MDWLYALVEQQQGGMEWWRMCLRASAVAIFGLVLLRLSGKRLRGRWGAVDIIFFVIIGSNLSRAITGNAPLVATMAATATLVLLHAVVTAAAVRWRPLGPLFKGRAAQLIKDGRLDERAMRRHSVGQGDLDEALRCAGLKDVAQVEEAWIERSGRISIIRR